MKWDLLRISILLSGVLSLRNADFTIPVRPIMPISCLSKSLGMAAAMLLVPAAHAQRPAASGPLKAELHTVSQQPFNQILTAVGTLRANESVMLVAELSKRLVEIPFEEGSDVKAGSLLFKLDDSDLRAELAEIDARIRLATANKDRAAGLLPNKAISQQEFDLAASELEVLEAQHALKAVELEKTRIRAPFSGRAGVRLVSVGAFLSQSTPLVELQDISSIKVDFTLPERHAPDVRVGQKFTFTVAGNGKDFEGEITVIEPSIDAATRSLRLRGLCDSPDGLLPGGFAEISLVLNDAAESITIPTQALIPSARGQGVYRIKDGKAELQSVRIGTRTPDQVQILQGLEKGDVIALTNLLRIRPGSEVVSATTTQP